MVKNTVRNKIKAKKDFFKQGTCSRTFFYILNREFGHPKEKEELATDLFAGGIKQLGYQCGMLWGASMGVGAETYRRYGNTKQAIAVTVNTTKMLMSSFEKTSGSIECEEITNTDFSTKWNMAKFMFSGRFYKCFTLADKWGQEAMDTVIKGFEAKTEEPDYEVYSCASEVLKQMNATEEEILSVSGFAGGLGLSGSGCGALSAAIWKNSLESIEKTDKVSFNNIQINDLIKKFQEETDYEIECSEMCQRNFNSLEEHSGYIKNGGCKQLIKILSIMP
jgi:hypothetical protein